MTVPTDVILRRRPGRPPQANGSSTRIRLLEAALSMFATHGLHGVSLSEIASAAGLTGPGIYNHFKSKDALFSEVVCQMYDEEEAAFRSVLDDKLTISSGLDVLLDVCLQINREDSTLSRLGITAQLECARDPQRFPEIIEAAKRRERVLIELASRALASQELPAGADVEEMGALLTSLIIGGLGVRGLALSDAGEFERAIMAFKTLLRAFRAAPRAASKACVQLLTSDQAGPRFAPEDAYDGMK